MTETITASATATEPSTGVLGTPLETAETAATPAAPVAPAPRTVAGASARTVATAAANPGSLTVRDLILVAVLLAAGAVLKLTVSSFFTFAGTKPNFMIAMYCLAIILIRPRLYQAVLIGLLTGIISQIPMLNATPLVNLASETLGALVCGLLVLALAKVAPANKTLQNVVFPFIITFLSTVVSGYTFCFIVGCAMNGLDVATVFVMYIPMVFGTAAANSILVDILVPVLRAVLKR